MFPKAETIVSARLEWKSWGNSVFVFSFIMDINRYFATHYATSLLVERCLWWKQWFDLFALTQYILEMKCTQPEAKYLPFLNISQWKWQDGGGDKGALWLQNRKELFGFLKRESLSVYHWHGPQVQQWPPFHIKVWRAIVFWGHSSPEADSILTCAFWTFWGTHLRIVSSVTTHTHAHRSMHLHLGGRGSSSVISW